MVATNHALTGAIIGLSIGHPVALPLAFMSHFVLDAIPHYGEHPDHIQSRRFVVQLIIDASLCGVLVLFLAASSPAHWLLAVVCAFLAASPDFMWIPKFLRARRGQPEKGSDSLIIRFHTRIQWFQRPAGAAVEAVWLAVSLTVLANLL